MRVEAQLKLDAISTEVKKLVEAEVFAQVSEWYEWAKVQAASHHEIAVERTDQGDEDLADSHTALSSAYMRLAQEINAVVRETDIRNSSDRKDTV